jgi:hypothetical protein
MDCHGVPKPAKQSMLNVLSQNRGLHATLMLADKETLINVQMRLLYIAQPCTMVVCTILVAKDTLLQVHHHQRNLHQHMIVRTIMKLAIIVLMVVLKIVTMQLSIIVFQSTGNLHHAKTSMLSVLSLSPQIHVSTLLAFMDTKRTVLKLFAIIALMSIILDLMLMLVAKDMFHNKVVEMMMPQFFSWHKTQEFVMLKKLLDVSI